jgi:hypothetical protein
MELIPLQAVPNQTLSVQIDNNSFDIQIQDCGGIMAASIVVNNVPLITGARAVNGFPIIPYAYLETNVGNFTFIASNDSQNEYPYWDRFNTDLQFVYVSPADLAGLSFADYIQGVLSGTGT